MPPYPSANQGSLQPVKGYKTSRGKSLLNLNVVESFGLAFLLLVYLSGDLGGLQHRETKYQAMAPISAARRPTGPPARRVGADPEHRSSYHHFL